MSTESIIDTTRPNPGRIYDYILGSHHNFEVDRQAAEQILKLLPFAPKVTRFQRWCLQDLAVELTQKRGFDVIIDLASGLPTNDHIHFVVPKNTTVIYSDYDPVVVEYAHQILKDTPNVYFFQADARRPEELLNRREVQEILGSRRDVALGLWGVSAFLTDSELAQTVHTLYEWAGPRGCLAFNAQLADVNPEDPAAAQTSKIYAQMGTPLHLRTRAEYQQLVQPWHPDEKGFVPLLEWHGFDPTEMSAEDRQIVGAAGGGYGAYLVK